MFRRKEDGSYRMARPSGLRGLLPAFLAAILLIPVLGAHAAVQDTSGTVQVGNSLQYGTTSYSVKYSYPSTIDVGSNLTISVTLHVNAFSGLVEYVTDYKLAAEVFIGGEALQGSVAGSQNASFLYPGSSWGPNNVTIPLTAADTGLATGKSANATLCVTLPDSVYYGGQQLNVYVTEPAMQGEAGGLLIQNPVTSTSTSSTVSGGAQTFLPYVILLVAGAAMMVGAALWPRGPGSSRADLKS